MSQLSAEMYAYFVECMRRSYLYFGVPQTRQGTLFIFYQFRLRLNPKFGFATCDEPKIEDCLVENNESTNLQPETVTENPEVNQENSTDGSFLIGTKFGCKWTKYQMRQMTIVKPSQRYISDMLILKHDCFICQFPLFEVIC